LKHNPTLGTVSNDWEPLHDMKDFTKRDWAETYLGAEEMVLPSAPEGRGKDGDYDVLRGCELCWLSDHMTLTIQISYL
jgi:hypothetical protein